MTAMGIEALIVIPTFRTKYTDDAPNNIPSKAPTKTGTKENSGMFASGGT